MKPKYNKISAQHISFNEMLNNPYFSLIQYFLNQLAQTRKRQLSVILKLNLPQAIVFLHSAADYDKWNEMN